MIYLAIMNLPRAVRFKRENIIIVGLLPGPSEPSKNMNSYLTPLVSDLLTLWEGFDCGTQFIRCALLCVLPAARKVCGFLSYTDAPDVTAILGLVLLENRTILDLIDTNGNTVAM